MQDVAVAIGDIRILPVERYRVISAVLVPEAKCGAGRHRPELLIEGAVSQRLVTVLLAMGICLWVAACKCGMGSGVWAVGPDYRIVDVAVNYPGREAASLKSTIYDDAGLTWRRGSRGSWRRAGCSRAGRRRACSRCRALHEVDEDILLRLVADYYPPVSPAADSHIPQGAVVVVVALIVRLHRIIGLARQRT